MYTWSHAYLMYKRDQAYLLHKQSGSRVLTQSYEHKLKICFSFFLSVFRLQCFRSMPADVLHIGYVAGKVRSADARSPLEVLRQENELLRSTIENAEKDTELLEQQLGAGVLLPLSLASESLAWLEISSCTSTM